MPDSFHSPSRTVSAAGLINHDNGSFRRAFNLFHFPHRQLPDRARSSVEWAFLEFTDHGAHRPAGWPHAVEALDPARTMTAVEYLDELRALLTVLTDESTDLAATLRYQRARSELLAAGDVGEALVNPMSGEPTGSEPGVS